MGFLARLLHLEDEQGEHQRRRVAEAAARIVALNPHLHMARRAAARLAPSVATTLRHLDGILAAVPPSREASAAAWAEDPYIHAFFAAPGDVAPVLSRSNEVRAFFERHPDVPETYGVLGMAITEKHMLGVALEGETMRRDVMQETISFSDHQVRVCARTESELREEIVRRLVDQLGLQALAQAAGDRSRRDSLDKERALLKTRLALLQRQGVGVRGVMGGDPPVTASELARVQQEIVDNQRDLEQLGIRSEAIERTLGQICNVLSDPGAHIYVQSRRFYLNKMNVVLAEHSSEAGDEIMVQVARVPDNPPRMRAFTLMRFARAGLLPATSLYERAARLLG